MAKVVSKSAMISNRDASPPVFNNPQLMGQFIREIPAAIEVADGDSIDSTYIFAQVPSNCRISQILVHHDDIGAATAADFGVYKTTADGGAMVDRDFFGSAVALGAGAERAIDLTHESAETGAFDADDIEKPLWQALGLPSDPGIQYDIVATLTAAADGAGTLAAVIRYVI